MMTLWTTLKTRSAQRAQYRRTLAELHRLDQHNALDLGIYSGDFTEIARKAAYGA